MEYAVEEPYPSLLGLDSANHPDDGSSIISLLLIQVHIYIPYNGSVIGTDNQTTLLPL